MIAAFLLTLVALAGSTARVDGPGRRLGVGEPFDLTMVIEHAPGATIRWPDPGALPLSFAFQEDLGRRREAVAGEPARERSVARWRVLALEGGSVKLPALSFQVESAAGSETVSSAEVALDVAGALRPGEDAARAPKSFRETPVEAPRRGRALLVAVGAALLLAAGVWLVRRRRPVALASPAPRPLERLDELERWFASDPAHARDVVFGLTSVVRAAVDECLVVAPAEAAAAGRRRAALPDAEWVALVARESALPEPVRLGVARILTSTERWKYAGETPSALGLRKTLADARGVLAALPAARDAAALSAAKDAAARPSGSDVGGRT